MNASAPPKPPPPKAKPTLVKPSAKPAAPAHVAKTFAIKAWSNANEGEKIVMYGPSGAGKTTLASTAPNPIFIGFDDGGRKITHPVTGTELNVIDGITGFQDIRDALNQTNLWADGATCVFDTITKMEPIAEPYIFAHYQQNGQHVDSMRKYGWDGPAHRLDTLRLLLTDLDRLVRRGVNVILLAQQSQIRVANAEGADYLQDGPKLDHNNQYSSRNEVCEWSDHVFRIGYQNFSVVKDNPNAKAGKVKEGDATRAVFTGGAQHFIAKSRPIDGYRIPAVIGFAGQEDTSLWQFVFEGAKAE